MQMEKRNIQKKGRKRNEEVRPPQSLSKRKGPKVSRGKLVNGKSKFQVLKVKY